LAWDLFAAYASTLAGEPVRGFLKRPLRPEIARQADHLPMNASETAECDHTALQHCWMNRRTTKTFRA
jgi:hypothetical protein